MANWTWLPKRSTCLRNEKSYCMQKFEPVIVHWVKRFKNRSNEVGLLLISAWHTNIPRPLISGWSYNARTCGSSNLRTLLLTNLVAIHDNFVDLFVVEPRTNRSFYDPTLYKHNQTNSKHNVWWFVPFCLTCDLLCNDCSIACAALHAEMHSRLRQSLPRCTTSRTILMKLDPNLMTFLTHHAKVVEWRPIMFDFKLPWIEILC